MRRRPSSHGWVSLVSEEICFPRIFFISLSDEACLLRWNMAFEDESNLGSFGRDMFRADERWLFRKRHVSYLGWGLFPSEETCLPRIRRISCGWNVALTDETWLLRNRYVSFRWSMSLSDEACLSWMKEPRLISSEEDMSHPEKTHFIRGRHDSSAGAMSHPRETHVLIFIGLP